MKWGIAAAVAAVIVALLVRGQGQRAMDEAELWAEAGEQEPNEEESLDSDSF